MKNEMVDSTGRNKKLSKQSNKFNKQSKIVKLNHTFFKGHACCTPDNVLKQSNETT